MLRNSDCFLIGEIKSLEKLQNIINKFISILGLLVFAFILLTLLIVDHKETGIRYFYYTLPATNAQIVIVVAMVALVVFLCKYWKNRAGRGKKRQSFFSTHFVTLLHLLPLLLVQLFIVYHIFVYIGWDVSYLYDAANEYLDGNLTKFSRVYFWNNTNNVFLWGVNVLFLKIGQWMGVDGYVLMSIIGIILVDIAIYLTTQLVRLLGGSNRMMWISYGLMVWIIGLSPWIMVPYSDVYSICLPIVTLYLYVKWDGVSSRRFWRNLAICAPSILGMLVKPTNIIGLIAIIFVGLFRSKGKKSVRAWAKCTATFLLAILICFSGYVGIKQATYHALNYEENEVYEKTMLHYMYMGANPVTHGVFNLTDNAYTDSFSTTAEKNAADWIGTKERYGSMGFVGLCKHLISKTDLNYNMGILGWGKEWEFVMHTAERDCVAAAFLRNVYYLNDAGIVDNNNNFGEGGAYFPAFALFMQTGWLLILIGCLSYTGRVAIRYVRDTWNPRRKGSKRAEKEVKVAGNDADAENEKRREHSLSVRNYDNLDVQMICLLTLIGLFLFVTIFETNARYLMSYLPHFVTLATLGLCGYSKKEKVEHDEITRICHQ